LGISGVTPINPYKSSSAKSEMKARTALTPVNRCSPNKSTNESSSVETTPPTRNKLRHKLKLAAASDRHNEGLSVNLADGFVITGGLSDELAVGVRPALELMSSGGFIILR
jgi:hypothetical protein